MADEDEALEPVDPPEDDEVEEDLEGPEIDEVDLEEGDELEDLLVDDDDETFVEIDDEAVVEEEEDADPAAGPVRKTVPTAEDEDEDEDLLAPDDVEAALDTVLKGRRGGG